jgi:hypothetical protein
MTITLWDDLLGGWCEPDLSFAKDVIGGLPEAFYKAPSSVTGKYHPGDEIVEGGLAIHSWRMAKLMPDMSRMMSDIGQPIHALVLAAIIHDAFKPILSKDTYWEHPLRAAQHIIKEREPRPIWFSECAYACAIHEGRWTDPRILPKLGDAFDHFLEETKTHLSYLFHAADYVLSRRMTWEIMRNIPKEEPK